MRIEQMSLTMCLGMAHEGNPKSHDLNALIGSFRRFGFVAPPTIDEKTAIMVAGHGRCEALAQLRDAKFPPPEGVAVDPSGEWIIPVIRGVSFRTETERNAYIIADNQHVIAGGWDTDKLTEMLRGIEAGGGFEGVGFDAADMRALGLAADELLADDEVDEEGKPIDVDGHKRKRKSGTQRDRSVLQYRIVIACKDERHQAELLNRFEADGLDAKPVIV